jgi:hypothetical protein
MCRRFACVGNGLFISGADAAINKTATSVTRAVRAPLNLLFSVTQAVSLISKREEKRIPLAKHDMFCERENQPQEIN